MTTVTRPVRAVQFTTSEVALSIRADEALPPGIAGRVSGVALTYDVVDSYATVFARNCAKRSIDTKVKARKLPLLMDHSRTVGAHVGVVAQMTDAGDALLMTADLFDTPDGRAALDYVKTVIAAGASTGFSIGFVPRRSEMAVRDGQMVELFTEIELREVSLTPMPAVPGADVLGARNDDEAPDVAPAPTAPEGQPERSDVELLETAARVALEALPADVRAAVVSRYAAPLATPSTVTGGLGRTVTGTVQYVSLLPSLPSIVTVPAPERTERTTPEAPAAPATASMTQRLDAVRRSYAIPRGS